MTSVPRAALSFVVAAFALAALGAQSPSQPQPPETQAQQRPVFRGGTHFVRVDAYPVKDGKIVEGLQAEDFEVLEDGKPQKIESFDFLKFDGFTPEAERKDPQSQREGFDLAADPRYRVFVIYVDLAASKSSGAVMPNEDLPRIRQPLVNFLDRIMGDRDLFAFLTSRNSVKDLVFAQKTTVTIAAALDLWRVKVIHRDESDEVLFGCPFDPSLIGSLKAIRRIDQSYETLETLVTTAGLDPPGAQDRRAGLERADAREDPAEAAEYGGRTNAEGRHHDRGPRRHRQPRRARRGERDRLPLGSAASRGHGLRRALPRAAAEREAGERGVLSDYARGTPGSGHQGGDRLRQTDDRRPDLAGQRDRRRGDRQHE